MTALAEEQQNSSRYFVLSVGLHICMVVVANLVALMFIAPKQETIQIEVLSTPPPPPIARAQVVNDIPKAAMAPVRASRDEVVAKAPPKPSSKAPRAPLPVVAKAAPPRPSVPEPDFSDTMPESPVVVAPKFDSHLVDDDLNKVSEEESAKFEKNAAAHDQQIAAETDSLQKDLDSAADTLKKDADQKDSEMAAKSQAQQAHDRAELAKRRAAEAAAAQAAAQAKADQLAREGRAKGKDSTTGATIGGSDSGPVRQVADLRQMPGNKKPEYDEQERFNRNEGVVVFRAVVTRDGSLTGFRLVQSSGYRSLDLKAFKAMRTWKFYPGQQGPVEMPFVWNMKGGPQERPTGLRKKIDVSANNGR